MDEFLRQLEEWAAAVRALRDQILATAETETRNLTDDEDGELRRLSAHVRECDERIAEVRLDIAAEQRAGQVALATGGLDVRHQVEVRSSPLQYQRGDRSQSYFRDLGLALVGRDSEAMARLERHRTEMDVEVPRLEARREAAFQRSLDELRVGNREAMVQRDISRTDGAGGEFVPPLWILEEYAEYARAGRPLANQCRNIPLPGGTDSISVPRITGGTSTAAQTADNASVSETDMTTNSATGPVRTIAGQQDIALQLLEQSPLMFDEIVFADLTADYNSKLDVQIWNGSGSSGQHTGLLQLSGTNSVSYTDGSPTVPEFWPYGSQAISQAASGRKMPPTAVFMHSRRWYWMESTLDSSNRPLIVPAAVALNPFAIPSEVVAEGPAGQWHGLVTYLDQNCPTTLGGGTEDAVLVVRGPDLLLFEGALKTRALPEVLSGTLTVRLQVYAYSAFIGGRFPAGISKITGTGLAAPSGF